MSNSTQQRLLVFCGIATAAGTLAVQVMGFGELKGQIQTVIQTHSTLIEAHTNTINRHSEEIAEIKGKLHGIATQVGKMPSRIASKISEGQ